MRISEFGESLLFDKITTSAILSHHYYLLIMFSSGNPGLVLHIYLVAAYFLCTVYFLLGGIFNDKYQKQTTLFICVHKSTFR